jgi:hypothetical protein
MRFFFTAMDGGDAGNAGAFSGQGHGGMPEMQEHFPAKAMGGCRKCRSIFRPRPWRDAGNAGAISGQGQDGGSSSSSGRHRHPSPLPPAGEGVKCRSNFQHSTRYLLLNTEDLLRPADSIRRCSASLQPRMAPGSMLHAAGALVHRRDARFHGFPSADARFPCMRSWATFAGPRGGVLVCMEKLLESIRRVLVCRGKLLASMAGGHG